MSKLYTMVGLPGAGKSTFARMHPECVVVSSDAVRAELYGDEAVQGDAHKVFAVVNERVRKALAEGKDVIYDATSLTRKLRKGIIKTFDAQHFAVFMNTSIETCIARDAQRSRTVGKDVIMAMAQRMTKPSTDEGFDKIIIME